MPFGEQRLATERDADRADPFARYICICTPARLYAVMSSQTTGSAYLDHAATTPMRPEAIAAMTEELARLGNPSSLRAGRAR